MIDFKTEHTQLLPVSDDRDGEWIFYNDIEKKQYNLYADWERMPKHVQDDIKQILPWFKR